MKEDAVLLKKIEQVSDDTLEGQILQRGQGSSSPADQPRQEWLRYLEESP